jgi:glycosyltransferase involved in cell wall biosynthesis
MVTPAAQPVRARPDSADRLRHVPADAGAGTIAFLVNKFPRLSETFVLHEFLELRRQGVPLRLVSVRDPAEPVCHDEAVPLRDEVTYLRPAGVGRRWAALRHALRHYPIGLGWGLAWLARERDPAALKGLVDALVLVHLCDVEGVRHVHAHFATAPTAAAYLAYAIAGLPYSVTAHARDVYTTAPRALDVRLGAARAVMTCTDGNRAYLERAVGIAPGTVRVLRHGIPLRPFLDVQRAPVRGRLLTVARLVPKKGHELIARAVTQLCATATTCIGTSWAVARSGRRSSGW